MVHEKDRPRVLHLGRFYPPRGGVEAHVVSLLRGLQAQVDCADLVASPFGQPLVRRDISGFRVFHARSLGSFASTAIAPGFPFVLYRLARQFDIVHIHLPDPLSVVSALLLPEQIPLVATWHSDVIKQRRLLKLYQPFVDRLLKRCRVVIAPTPRHFTSSTQLYALDETRRHVIPFGVEEKQFAITDKVAESMKAWRTRLAGRRMIFAVGRHVYYKGFEYLIRSMPTVDDAVLILAGSGPLTPLYRSRIDELSLSDRVWMPGRIPEEDRIALLHLCDVFCMPSVEASEAFGLVQLDAMACGKPVVCCELNNGVTYVNQHGKSGLVVPACDAAALAEALNRLMKDASLRRRLGEWGKRRVREEFRYDRMVKETEVLYRAMLAR